MAQKGTLRPNPNWMMKFNSWHIILMHIQGIHLNSTESLEGGRLCV